MALDGLSTLWVLMAAFLVFFMQAGFGMVEAGLIRVELMREQWQDGKTHELFMIRMYPELLDKVTRVVADNLRVEKLTILDGGDGDGLPTHVRNLTKTAVVMLEQMKNATGVDLAKLAGTAKGAPGADIPKELD